LEITLTNNVNLSPIDDSSKKVSPAQFTHPEIHPDFLQAPLGIIASHYRWSSNIREGLKVTQTGIQK
jgi:hypothetical protein